MPALCLESKQGIRARDSERMRRVSNVAAPSRALRSGKAQVQEPVVQICTCMESLAPHLWTLYNSDLRSVEKSCSFTFIDKQSEPQQFWSISQGHGPTLSTIFLVQVPFSFL